jgi:hypothetical protein
MIYSKSKRRRKGATVVESAVVYPVTFFIILALIIGGLGIYRYQEVAYLAREGARYAAVHGFNYWNDVRNLRYPACTPSASGSTSRTYTDTETSTVYLVYQPSSTSTAAGTYTNWADDIYGNSINPEIVILDPANITCEVQWPAVKFNPNMPDNGVGSQVRVSVSYSWVPGITMWLPGLGEVDFTNPINLTSVSSMPITN